MMAADKEGTVRKLKAVQAAVLPIIAEHGGRVISLVGDGFIAEFAGAIRAVSVGSKARIAASFEDIGDQQPHSRA